MNEIFKLEVTDRAVCTQYRLDIIIHYYLFFVLGKKSFYNKICKNITQFSNNKT